MDRGVANKERVLITVMVPVNLSYYAVLATQAFNEQNILAGGRQIYWFHSVWVKPGDNVILYTGVGMNTAVARPDGGSDHIFYWGFFSPIWNDPNWRAVLFELSTWFTSM
jgi:hypothetical protein